jgi:hypothetical protein
MISPANATTLSGASQVFTWTNAGASLYKLWVGSTPGTSDIGMFPPAGTAATTTTVTGLPTGGSTLYVRLWSKVGSTWAFNDYTYTAAGTASAATMVTPTNASTLTGASQAFTWTNSGASLYQVWVGTTAGGSEIGMFPPAGTTAAATTVTGLPTNGSILYVRLWSKIGSAWSFNDYSYTAASGTPAAAAMVTPLNGSTISGTSQTFTWTNAGANLCQLWAGTTPGGSNLGMFPASGTTGTSTTTNGLTTSGTVYVRLWTQLNGSWVFNDYTYTAGP